MTDIQNSLWTLWKIIFQCRGGRWWGDSLSPDIFSVKMSDKCIEGFKDFSFKIIKIINVDTAW